MTRYFKSILASIILALSFTVIANANDSIAEHFVVDRGVSAKNYYVNGALDISGVVSYNINNSTRNVNTTIERITNNSALYSSGTIHIKLFVTASPITGSFTYWTVAEYATSPSSLLPGYYMSGLSGNTPALNVPNGIYYIHVGVFEYEPPGSCGNGSNQYCMDDYVTFTERVQVTNGVWSKYVPPVTVPTTGTAVEYYHAGFNHYFMTSIPAEISVIDGGAYGNAWVRTGYTYKVYPLNTGSTSNVCRFFSTSFDPKSSHFYTPLASECASVKTNPNWRFEGEVFALALPSGTGSCASGQSPLYRLYNNGMSGAPNHRYTVNTTVRQSMINLGWTPEGYGPLGVIGCVPN